MYYWKRVLKPGAYGKSDSTGRKNYTTDDLQRIADNGKSLLQHGVACPVPATHRDPMGLLPRPVLLADDNETPETDELRDARTGSHIPWNPLVNQGFVVDWEYLDDPSAAPPDLPNPNEHKGWLLAKVEIPDDNLTAIEAIQQQRVRSTSIGLVDSYEIPHGENPLHFKGGVPMHLALTLNPLVGAEDEGFIPATTNPAETHSLTLLSDTDDSINNLYLFSDATKPMYKNQPSANPIAGNKPVAPPAGKPAPTADSADPPKDPNAPMDPSGEEGNEDPAEQGLPESPIQKLISAVNASGFLPLPPDTTEENAIERICTLLHAMSVQNGNDPSQSDPNQQDPNAPAGNPPKGSHDPQPPTLMSDTNPLNKMLNGYVARRQKARLDRAAAIASRSPEMAEYVKTKLMPLLEATPAVLMSDTATLDAPSPVLDDITGEPVFQSDQGDLLLDALEAVPATPKLDLTTPMAGSKPVDLPNDLDPETADQLTEADKVLINQIAGSGYFIAD